MVEHDPIYVTGASGYLGSHIMRILGGEGRAVPRDGYSQCRGKRVIHCAAVVPQNELDAEDGWSARVSLQLVDAILDHRPDFLVYVSTRAFGSAYAEGKREGERRVQESGIPHHIVRFPGLFGPPRKEGLAYNAARAILLGDVFIPNHHPLPYWTGMHVNEAAHLCVELARKEQPGMTTASNPALEEFLDWVRT